MTLLAELFGLLENEPEPSGNDREKAGMPTPSANRLKVAAPAPAIHGHSPTLEPRQAATMAPPAPTPALAAERPAEARRNAWTVTRGGRPICTVCGAPMTRDEALAEARWRWPDAEILES